MESGARNDPSWAVLCENSLIAHAVSLSIEEHASLRHSRIKGGIVSVKIHREYYWKRQAVYLNLFNLEQAF
jgi:hypothetical protein